ncbi:hypothetical protein [Rhodoferax sp. U11-2br]|uniref:hypothetical protein n=1 Tax=Rhodoferax sp. U11-2br TaxID=2838878 RepID=UPI001BEA9F6A|nr:hypothetical protein [Rhodoferax sp. U11-2br]MBT3068395.1 hypothetical protein [Rhodoferax sp. U11-2br]
MTDIHTFKPVLAVHATEDAAFSEYFGTTQAGIRIVPEPYGDSGSSVKAEAGDFAKWVRSKHPEVPVLLPESVPKIVLHGAEVWLPLVYLAGDISMQVFLNMAASYLYDNAKGSLKTDQPRIHMSVVYQDKKLGKTKRFEFSGDGEALSKAIKRFDLDNFFDAGP